MKLFSNKLFAFAIGICIAGSLFAQETKEEPIEETKEEPIEETKEVSIEETKVETKEVSKTTFKFGGFAKTDFMLTQYNNGAYSGAGRDFHIPSTIPVGNIDVYTYSDFHVKESRFNFDVSTLVKGKQLRTFVELDFMLSGQGDERVSNSYSPRIRHFYLEYDKILVGQTWSTFMVVIIPDELDFIGAAEGVVFVRQPMARITLGGLQLAIENQYATISYNKNDPASPATGRIVSETGLLPDAVVRYNLKLGEGNISFAAIGRYIHFKDPGNTKHNTIGTGITVGGKMKIGRRDDIRFVGTGGFGLGRYVGLNFVNSSVIDNSANLKPIPTLNGYVAYLHHWSSKLRSSASASYLFAKNDPSIIGVANNRAASISANILFQPVDKLLFGAEAMWGYREMVGGANGDFVRVQFSAKYAFSFKTSVSN